MNLAVEKLAVLLSGTVLMTTFSPTTEASESDRVSDRVLTDFTSATPDFGWYVVNDNVMGGRSEGGFEETIDGLHFAGHTNTDGGGFSSLRTGSLDLDLSAFEGIRLRVKGDGRRYTWRLATNARWRGRQLSYWASFDTRYGSWQTVDIPFSRFIPNYRGYRLDGPVVDRGQIEGMGLMIYDEQDGAFELQLESVSAYAAGEPFKLSQYQWKKRVLVLSAASPDDEALRNQRRHLVTSLKDFEARDLVLVELVDTADATADGRHLSAADVAATRKQLGIADKSFTLHLIGKDGSVKLARGSTTPMEEIYALIDTMPMRRAEVSRGD